VFDHLFSFSAFPCVFALLPDRKKLTYQQLFKELKNIAASMNRMWKPDEIVTDFESSLMPAIAAEVNLSQFLYLIILVFLFILVSRICA
jgi:hypothetical protein